MENREARDRGQGAARDSPRCLTAPGMKTKTGDAQWPKSPKVLSFLKIWCAIRALHVCLLICINISAAAPYAYKKGRPAAGLHICRYNTFTTSGHQKIEMLWGHAGNYHGAAFELVA